MQNGYKKYTEIRLCFFDNPYHLSINVENLQDLGEQSL